MNKIRLKYEKNEQVKYLGHLDTVIVFDRAFRRSNIQIKFSQGFNPRPIFVFALPSGSGLISKSEYLEVELDENEKANNNEIIDSLNKVLPVGFRIIEAEFVNNNKSLMSKVDSSKYEINILFDNLNDIEFEQVFSNINKIFASESIITKKKTKKGEKEQMIDIKPYIIDISICEISEKYLHDNIKGICILLFAKAGSVQNLRPDYIVNLIEDNGILIYDYQVIRTELLLDK